MSANVRRYASELSFVTTLIDAALRFRRGQRREGVVLLAAAALSRRFPGAGTVASVLLRVLRRLR